MAEHTARALLQLHGVPEPLRHAGRGGSDAEQPVEQLRLVRVMRLDSRGGRSPAVHGPHAHVCGSAPQLRHPLHRLLDGARLLPRVLAVPLDRDGSQARCCQPCQRPGAYHSLSRRRVWESLHQLTAFGCCNNSGSSCMATARCTAALVRDLLLLRCVCGTNHASE